MVPLKETKINNKDQLFQSFLFTDDDDSGGGVVLFSEEVHMTGEAFIFIILCQFAIRKAVLAAKVAALAAAVLSIANVSRDLIYSSPAPSASASVGAGGISFNPAPN